MKKQLFSKLVRDEWIPFHHFVEKSEMDESECRKSLNEMINAGKAERVQYKNFFLYAKKGTSHNDVIKAKIYNRLKDGNSYTTEGIAKILHTDKDIIQALIDGMPDVEEIVNKKGNQAYVLRDKPPVPEFVTKYPVLHIKKPKKPQWQELNERGDWFLGYNEVFKKMAERMLVTMGGFIEPYEFVR